MALIAGYISHHCLAIAGGLAHDSAVEEVALELLFAVCVSAAGSYSDATGAFICRWFLGDRNRFWVPAHGAIGSTRAIDPPASSW